MRPMSRIGRLYYSQNQRLTLLFLILASFTLIAACGGTETGNPSDSNETHTFKLALNALNSRSPRIVLSHAPLVAGATDPSFSVDHMWININRIELLRAERCDTPASELRTVELPMSPRLYDLATQDAIEIEFETQHSVFCGIRFNFSVADPQDAQKTYPQATNAYSIMMAAHSQDSTFAASSQQVGTVQIRTDQPLKLSDKQADTVIGIDAGLMWDVLPVIPENSLIDDANFPIEKAIALYEPNDSTEEQRLLSLSTLSLIGEQRRSFIDTETPADLRDTGIYISELHHGDKQQLDWLELHNPTDQEIDLFVENDVRYFIAIAVQAEMPTSNSHLFANGFNVCSVKTIKPRSYYLIARSTAAVSHLDVEPDCVLENLMSIGYPDFSPREELSIILVSYELDNINALSRDSIRQYSQWSAGDRNSSMCRTGKESFITNQKRLNINAASSLSGTPRGPGCN